MTQSQRNLPVFQHPQAAQAESVSRVLHLEYACTPAEMEEAQNLNTQEQIGRGSKWRANLVLGSVIAMMLLSFYLRVRREFSPGSRLYAFAGFFVIVALVLLWQRRAQN